MAQKAFAGNGKPFIYAIYAQEDKEAAGAVLSALWDKGYELWPSERFEKPRLRKAALVLFFLSPAAAASEAVTRTMQEAARRDSAMLVIHLTHTELTPTQKLLLNTQQAILKYNCLSDDAFYEKLFGAQPLQNLEVTRAQKRAASLTTWGSIAGILCAVAVAIYLALGTSATISKESILAELGYSGKTGEISEIWVYGDSTMDRCSEKAIPRTFPHETNHAPCLLVDNGTSECNEGTIDSIFDFAQLKNLKKLALAGNQITDISPLYDLKKLDYLDLTANPISDLSRIGEMRALETLYIDYTNVTDLSPLFECKSLKTVYIDDAQAISLSDAAKNAPFEFVVVGPLEEINSLHCHIYGGVEGYDFPSPGRYGVFMETKSCNAYTGYEYQVFKDGVPLQIETMRYTDINGDGSNDKIDIDITHAAMPTYDPAAEYTLVVRYQSHRATYHIWHKFDDGSEFANEGRLIESAS
jgi:hypothetical protein